MAWRKSSGARPSPRACDGKFWDEDLCPDILPFVVWYYDGGQYWEDYVEWVVNQLCDLPLEFVGSWEDYLQFEPVLDQAYQDYQDDMPCRPPGCCGGRRSPPAR